MLGVRRCNSLVPSARQSRTKSTPKIQRVNIYGDNNEQSVTTRDTTEAKNMPAPTSAPTYLLYGTKPSKVHQAHKTHEAPYASQALRPSSFACVCE